jgi:hypothetical protein
MKKAILLSWIILSCLHAQTQPVYVVLFTHIEDNTPTGTLGSQQSRDHYMFIRSKMIEMANLAHQYNVKWSFQPDWKILLAALMYEDSVTMVSTNGKNFLRYLKEDLDVIIDPHSHEKLGYNYTDVAHLLDSLGVSGSTVIGGHIWDPSLPQFQNWDRFRVPVPGSTYPWAIWRGNILMGSGTPNHVNDPKISGVWRPKDRYNYFVDDTSGNIACIGQYKSDITGISELINLYDSGSVSHEKMLTSSYHITPSSITASNGIAIIESTVIQPLISMRNQNKIKLTDFTSLIEDWHTHYYGKAFIYDPNNPTDIHNNEIIPPSFKLFQNFPNAFNPTTTIGFEIPEKGNVRLSFLNILGEEIRVLLNEEREAGYHSVDFNGSALPSGVYFYRIQSGNFIDTKKMILLK